MTIFLPHADVRQIVCQIAKFASGPGRRADIGPIASSGVTSTTRITDFIPPDLPFGSRTFGRGEHFKLNMLAR